MKRENKKKIKWSQIVLHAVFIIIAILYIAPLLVVVSASFSTETALMDRGFSLLPVEFTFEAYQIAFRNPGQIIASYGTTIIFSAATTVLAVLVMGITAYPLSRSNFRLKNAVTFYFFFKKRMMMMMGG